METHPVSSVTADFGGGATVADASAWSVSRSLSGGGLPGQVRASAGLGTGGGSVTFGVPDGRTPWRVGPVAPGGLVALDASVDGGPSSPLARMVTRSIAAPSALGVERTATIEDDLTGLRGPVNIPATLGSAASPFSPVRKIGIDASWAIDEAAREAGFLSTAPTAGRTLFSLPLAGSPLPDVGTVSGTLFGADWRWLTAAGRATPVPPGAARLDSFLSRAPVSTVWFSADIFAGGGEWFTIDNIGWMPGVSVEFVDIDLYPYVVVKRAGVDDVRVPWSAPDGEWAHFDVGINLVAKTVTFIIDGVSQGTQSAPWLPDLADAVDHRLVWSVVGTRVRGVQINDGPTPPPWTPPTAIIAASGSPLEAVLTGPVPDGLALISEVCDATMSASWIDEAGVFRFVDRDTLRGAGTVAGTITAHDLTDIPWSISADDMADRAEITFQPPAIIDSPNGTATLWEATESQRINPGQTITINATIEGAADSLAPWYPIWATAPVAGRGSRWSASTLPDGSGTQPADDALTVNARLLSPSRAEIRITNNTTTVLYTGSGDQTTQLILRASYHARPGEPETVGVGATSEAARTPISINAGAWIQDRAVAEELAHWLAAETSTPAVTLTSVECVPDLNIKLGDVRVLRDPQHTGIASKVLVTGVNWSGGPGELTQTLDLALLAVTFADLDRVLTGMTFEQLDTLWAGKTFADLDHWIDTEGVPS